MRMCACIFLYVPCSPLCTSFGGSNSPPHKLHWPSFTDSMGSLCSSDQTNNKRLLSWLVVCVACGSDRVGGLAIKQLFVFASYGHSCIASDCLWHVSTYKKKKNNITSCITHPQWSAHALRNTKASCPTMPSHFFRLASAMVYIDQVRSYVDLSK